MTEDEHIRLTEAGTEFCQEIALAAARVIAQFPSKMADDVMYYLQDQTSLFSPFTADRITLEVRRLRNKLT